MTNPVKKLSKLANKLDLVQLNKNPTKKSYTWCDAEHSPKSRLDYIFMRNDLIDYVKNIVVQKLPGTHKNTRLGDHRYIKCISNLVIWREVKDTGN